jgi:general secretion pathway protein L
MPRLLLRVQSEAIPRPDDEGFDIAVEWLVKENDGHVRGHGVTDFRGLTDLADPNQDWLEDPNNTVVFLPSQFVLMVSCDVPGRSAAQIRRALPFAAEEYVASDIEQMHIAHGAIKPGNPVACNIVSHEVMENWLACFKEAGVNPGYFIADAQMLSQDAGTTSVLLEGSMALVASNNQAANVDRGNLTFALNSLETQQLIVIGGELTDLELGQLDELPQVESIALSEYGALDYLGDRVDQTTFINLLQDRYKAVRPRNPQATRWRTVGVLAAAWVLVAFVGLIVQGWWAASEADRLEAETYAFYKSIFPGASQPVTLQQLRRNVGAKIGVKTDAGEGGAFVDLTAQFANVVGATNEVVSMSYAEQRKEVTIEVMLNSYDDIETIKTKLASAGVAVDVANAEEEGAKVRSRLRVRYAT